jgi:hypothetical protein
MKPGMGSARSQLRRIRFYLGDKGHRRDGRADAAGRRSSRPRLASPGWYGHPFHGRPTASGEIFDMASRLVYREGDQTWRMLVGMENSEENAGRLVERIEPSPGGTFVVRIDSEQKQ